MKTNELTIVSVPRCITTVCFLHSFFFKLQKARFYFILLLSGQIPLLRKVRAEIETGTEPGGAQCSHLLFYSLCLPQPAFLFFIDFY